MIPSLLIPIVALSLALPSPQSGRRVHDFADLLPPAVESALEQELRATEAATTAEIAVVTVASLEGASVEEYAHELFNTWGIGKRGTNNGILLLVSLRDRRARIEVGYGLEPLFPDGLCGELLDANAIPRFRSGDYAAGIDAAARAITKRLREHPEEARGIAGSLPAFLDDGRGGVGVASGLAAAIGLVQLVAASWGQRRRRYGPGAFFTGFVLTGAGGIGLAATALPALGHPETLMKALPGAFMTTLALLGSGRVFLRYGPNACRTCGARLQLLSEADDDARLTAAQRVEEELGSVDYDVWICPRCLKYETNRYLAWFSGFTTCPRCDHRTMKQTQTIITHATTLGEGRMRVDGLCASCKHETTHYETIARVSSSSGDFGSGGGSSGGGFSGGSSGGGGASRGW